MPSAQFLGKLKGVRASLKVRWRFEDGKLMVYETLSRSSLKKKQNEKRLQWAMTYDHWDGNEWGAKLFKDDCKVQRFGNKRPQFV